jgi:hypothetical protein
MKKALFILSALLVLGLLAAGCSPLKTATTTENTQTGTGATGAASTTPDAYIDDQFVDENSSVDVGSLI